MSSVPPTATGAFSLDWLLAPVDSARFVEHYWETAPLLVSREAPEYFTDLPGLDSIDELLATTVSSRPRPQGGERLVRSTSQGTLSQQAVKVGANGVLDMQAVYRAYHKGFTVVINQVQRRSAVIGQLCRSLEVALHHPVGANLYLTPAGAQGFRPHVDTHDVLIAQLHGWKEWHVSDPTLALPLAQRKPTTGQLVGARTYVLTPGDTFYLPRGFRHEAVTAQSSSLHLTIGIHAFRWRDILVEALNIWAEEDVAPRAALPPKFLDQELDRDRVRALLDALGAALADGSLTERAKQRIGSRLVARDVVAEHGHFRSLDALAALTEDSVVARPPELLALVRATEDAVTVEFAGNFVTGPRSIGPALKYIAAHGEFAVGQLPGELSTQDRIDLVSRLVSEGLLEVKGHE